MSLQLSSDPGSLVDLFLHEDRTIIKINNGEKSFQDCTSVYKVHNSCTGCFTKLIISVSMQMLTVL